VPYLKVGVVESLLAADALGWVEAEHLREKVDGERIGMWIEGRKWHSGFDGQRSDVVLGLNDSAQGQYVHALKRGCYEPEGSRPCVKCPQKEYPNNAGSGSIDLRNWGNRGHQLIGIYEMRLGFTLCP
jgi:hypothetical protein